MGQPNERKRPWFAALLTALATGLGHLYLRRWRRAAGWLVVVFGVSFLFVDPAAFDAFVRSQPVDPLAVAPLFVVVGLSVVDAYLLAHAHNAAAQGTGAPDGRITHCPHCGNELDPELGFCHWCTTEFGEMAVVPPEGRGEETDR